MAISAKSGAGLGEVVEVVRRMVAGNPRRVMLRMPAKDGKAASVIEQQAEVADRRYGDGHVEMEVTLGGWALKRLVEQFPAIQVVER